MGFRANLERELAARHWQPVQLAAAFVEMRCPMNLRTIERWLTGESEPQPAALFALSAVLNLTPDELMADRVESHEDESSAGGVTKQGAGS